jgi:hypothetical protein
VNAALLVFEAPLRVPASDTFDHTLMSFAGTFEGEFQFGLPSGTGTWTMDKLPGDTALPDGQFVTIKGEWKGLQPAPGGVGAQANEYVEARVGGVSSRDSRPPFCEPCHQALTTC